MKRRNKSKRKQSYKCMNNKILLPPPEGRDPMSVTPEELREMVEEAYRRGEGGIQEVPATLNDPKKIPY